MELTDIQLDLLRDWNEAKLQTKQWTEKESLLRDTLVKELFTADKDEGTESIAVKEWTLKVTKKLNYSLNNKDGEVSAICATLPELVSKQLVNWKPELSLSAYRKTDTATQKLFTNVLTIKPAKPTLELIPPEP
jgi:hypothetical protein